MPVYVVSVQSIVSIIVYQANGFTGADESVVEDVVCGFRVAKIRYIDVMITAWGATNRAYT